MAVKIRIQRKALYSALESARNVFPNEFIALLRGEEKEKEAKDEGETEKEVLLTELIITPLSSYGPRSSSFSPWHLPPNLKELASFHSHPGQSASPSRGDLHAFSRIARYHFISCPPFTPTSTRAFDSRGRELDFKVV